MRGWRSKRANTTVGAVAVPIAAPVAAPSPAPVAPEPDPEPAKPVEALLVAAEEPPPPETPAAPVATPAPQLEMQVEFLRLLEVVTSMCDHVIEYIEADRAERRMMIETLAELGRVITDGAAASVAAAAAAQPVAQQPLPQQFEMRERVIGGSMPAGPAPMIDLVGPEPETPVAPAPTPETTPGQIEIAVEVRGRFGDRWVDGFEICEVLTTPDGPRYRLRRHRDGVVLPELFDATNIRHVETFEQLSGEAVNAPPDDNGRGRRGSISGSPGYWSRS